MRDGRTWLLVFADGRANLTPDLQSDVRTIKVTASAGVPTLHAEVRAPQAYDVDLRELSPIPRRRGFGGRRMDALRRSFLCGAEEAEGRRHRPPLRKPVRRSQKLVRMLRQLLRHAPEGVSRRLGRYRVRKYDQGSIPKDPSAGPVPVLDSLAWVVAPDWRGAGGLLTARGRTGV